MSHLKKRWLAIVATLAVVSGTAFVLFMSPTSAEGSATPDHLETGSGVWNVSDSYTSRYTNKISAIVFDLQEHDGKMYVGGKFLNLVDPDGKVVSSGLDEKGNPIDPDVKSKAPAFLAAFDLETGEWVPSFFPDELGGPVYSVDLREDGMLVVGGEFKGGIAVIDPETGERDKTFDAGLKNSGKPAVFDVEVVDGQIYAGGAFTESNGVSLRRLGRFDAVTGELDTGWTPETMFDEDTPRSAGEVVYGIAVDVSRDRVYIVGKFGGINGNTEAAYFATLDTNGNVRTDVRQGIPANVLNHREGWSMWQHDVQFRGDKVYIGGQGHQTAVMNADDLTATSAFSTSRGIGDTNNGGGDTQVIFLGRDTIWSGAHAWDSVGSYPLGSYNGTVTGENGIESPVRQTEQEYRQWIADFATETEDGQEKVVSLHGEEYAQQKVKGIYGVNMETEELIDIQFDLSGKAGPWALYEDSLGQLWAGGQFAPGNSKYPDSVGLVRFSATEAGVDPGAGEFVPKTAAPVVEEDDKPPVADPVDEENQAIPIEDPTVASVPDPVIIDPLSGQCQKGIVPDTFDLSAPGSASIYRLYCAYFQRYPDGKGFEQWQTSYAADSNLARISAHFDKSRERSQIEVPEDNLEYVKWLYKTVLLREADAAGEASWTAALENGLSRSDLVLKFSNSREFRSLTATE